MDKISDTLYNWASDIDPQALVQAGRTSRLPIIAGHVALMPDAHVGMGATVGSVIPTEGAIIPSAVGVDIGCGMIGTQLNLTASQLPDNLDLFMPYVSQAIPAGVGKGHEKISIRSQTFMAFNKEHSDFSDKQAKAALAQFGTLGSGNHFFEICLDEDDQVWFVLHSGSRGIGNQLAQVHMRKAKKLANELHLHLEDPDLAYFTQDQPEFQEYIRDMLWAQLYALRNRDQMMQAVLLEFAMFMGGSHSGVKETINCHHNFTEMEYHPSNGPYAMPGAKKLWITRKGAIKADKGDKGIIPGSMGAKTYIVQGKGNSMSYNSCSHGAGRRMSRSAAKREFSVEDLEVAMEGKSWNHDKAQYLVDEIPSSYKDIDQVMADQEDLVTVTHVLHQVLNYKGA